MVGSDDSFPLFWVAYILEVKKPAKIGVFLNFCDLFTDEKVTLHYVALNGEISSTLSRVMTDQRGRISVIIHPPC